MIIPLLLYPFLLVLMNRCCLHRHGYCRKPLGAAAVGVLAYWFLLAPAVFFGNAAAPSAAWLAVALAVMTFCECFQLYLCIQFALEVDTSLFAMATMTAPAEIREFLRRNCTAALLACLALLALLLTAAIPAAFRLPLAPSPVTAAVLAALFLAKIIESILKRRPYHAKRPRTFCQILQKHNVLLQLLLGLWLYRQHFQLLVKASSHTPEVSCALPADAPPLFGCVVVGESATRSRHQLYGCPRPTTPALCELQRQFPNRVLAFDNVIAAIPTTPESFEFIFTRHEIGSPAFTPRYTLPALLHQTGFHSAFFGAQPRFSSCDTPQTLIFSACNRSENLNQTAGKERDTARSVYDEALIPYALETLEQTSQTPAALFLNLYGSHLIYQNRYPETWKCPFHDNDTNGLPPDLPPSFAPEWNHYDNSIAYTDATLAPLCRRILTETSRPAFLIYFSDHGEVLPDGKRLQRSRQSHDRDAYDIPFLFVFNDIYAKLFPDIAAAAANNLHQPLQMDRVFATLAHAFALQSPDLPRNHSLFSPDYTPDGNRTMDLGQVPYDL